MRCQQTMVLIVLGAMCPTSFGSVAVTLQWQNDNDDTLVAGDIVDVPVMVTAGGFAIAGVSLDLECTSQDVRICNVVFDPSFVLRLEEDSQQLPGGAYHSTRVQSPTTFDPGLATFGEQRQIATVTLEIITDGPFNSGLSVGINASTMDTDQPETLIRIGQDGELRQGPVVLPITNRQAAPAYDPPALETASATIELREVGSSIAATTLQQGTPYELHYSTTAAGVDAFVIFGIAPTADQRVYDVSTPLTGLWSSTTNYFAQPANPNTPAAPARGFPEGWYRTDAVMNDLIGTDGTITAADSTGHLCTITPRTDGDLKLEVYLFYANDAANTLTETSTTRSLPIQAVPDATTNGADE